MISRRQLSPVLVVALLLSTSAMSEEKPWREIRSPHFRVITNGSEGAGRHVAREFEQMRNLFADQFPGFNVDCAPWCATNPPRTSRQRTK